MKKAPGTIGWHDLTVDNADQLRDFYADVLGWTADPLDMGGYSDYVMKTADGEGVAGVCHARGANANIPPQWLVYFMVTDIDASVAACEARGGSLATP
ncbi:MAG TPA: VOC family protein, partial [Longimicrobiales bacterium]|nr:VOC family protein [Longimicrobiales bacterium]